MKLYKYRIDNEHTEDMLKNSELYLSRPKEFNDPFDCKSRVLYKGCFTQWKAMLLRQGNNDEDATKIAKQMKDKTLIGDEYAQNDIDQNENRICCFSKTRDNILLWSHYANRHTGICIEYTSIQEGHAHALRLEENPPQLKSPLDPKYLAIVKVKYKKTFPKAFNPFKEKSIEFLRFIKTKAINWKYEHEQRIILVDTLLKNNPVKISRNCITGIIFGLKIEDSIRQKYIDIAKKFFINAGFPIKLYQCEEKIGYYVLNIKEIII